MKDTRLLKIFNDTKDVLCKYDYYIHTAKRILHLTNTELKIPHLMGLQYVGRPASSYKLQKAEGRQCNIKVVPSCIIHSWKHLSG